MTCDGSCKLWFPLFRVFYAADVNFLRASLKGAFHRNYVHFLEREMNWSRSNIKGAKFQIFSIFYMCYDIVNRHFCYSHKFNSLHKR